MTEGVPRLVHRKCLTPSRRSPDPASAAEQSVTLHSDCDDAGGRRERARARHPARRVRRRRLLPGLRAAPGVPAVPRRTAGAVPRGRVAVLDARLAALLRGHHPGEHGPARGRPDLGHPVRRRGDGIPPTAGMVNRIAGVHVYLGQFPITSPWQIGARAERFGPIRRPASPTSRPTGRATAPSSRPATRTSTRSLRRVVATSCTTPCRTPTPSTAAGGACTSRSCTCSPPITWVLRPGRRPRTRPAADRAVARRRGDVVPATDERLASRRAGPRARRRRCAHGGAGGHRTGADTGPRHRAPQGATWWAEFEAFLAVWGQRTDETATIDRPSWAEHPATPLATIREFLATAEGHDFAAARRDVLAERDRLVDAAREAITDPADRDGSTRRWPPTGPRTSSGGTRSTTSSSTGASTCRCAG